MYRFQAEDNQMSGGIDVTTVEAPNLLIVSADADGTDGTGAGHPEPLVTDADRATPGLYQRAGKRVLDVAVAGTMLVFLSPLMAVLWCLLRVTLGRDVVITQDRVGLNGETFGMYKFRTMRWSRRSLDHPFHGNDRRVAHKVDHDPRHTPLGRVLRKLSFDELPQLVNVLTGSMSVVGPRPEMATVVDRLGQRDHIRHSVRPGMTGEWQVSGRQSGAPLHECFDEDLPYLGRVTFRNDLGILFRTIAVVIQRGGR